MRALLPTVLTCSAVLSLMGCESLASRTRYLTGPEALRFEENGDFRVEAQPAMRGSTNLAGEILRVYMSGFPPGTELVVDDQSAIANDEGKATVEAVVRARFGEISGADGFQQPQLATLSFELRPPGADPLAVTIPAKRVYGLHELLAASVNSPVLFGDEKPGDPMQTVLWYESDYSKPIVFGAAPANLADVDGVVMLTREGDQEKVCTGYVNDRTGEPAPDIVYKLRDTVVRIHDRRTAKVAAETRLPPEEECPSFEIVDGDDILSPVPKDDVQAWVRQQLAP